MSVVLVGQTSHPCMHASRPQESLCRAGGTTCVLEITCPPGQDADMHWSQLKVTNTTGQLDLSTGFGNHRTSLDIISFQRVYSLKKNRGWSFFFAVT